MTANPPNGSNFIPCAPAEICFKPKAADGGEEPKKLRGLTLTGSREKTLLGEPSFADRLGTPSCERD